MGRSKSSHRWLQEHFQDEYVKRAKAHGYRSRAVFKLMEIQEKDRFIKPGMNVIDLGAAPGGWTEYVRSLTSKKDKVVPISQAEKYRKKLKNSEIIIYKNIKGHFEISKFPELVKLINKDVKK